MCVCMHHRAIRTKKHFPAGHSFLSHQTVPRNRPSSLGWTRIQSSRQKTATRSPTYCVIDCLEATLMSNRNETGVLTQYATNTAVGCDRSYLRCLKRVTRSESTRLSESTRSFDKLIDVVCFLRCSLLSPKHRLFERCPFFWPCCSSLSSAKAPPRRLIPTPMSDDS